MKDSVGWCWPLRRSRVRSGTQLGLAGATGDASGPHVHFEVRLRGAYVDPMTAIG